MVGYHQQLGGHISAVLRGFPTIKWRLIIFISVKSNYVTTVLTTTRVYSHHASAVINLEGDAEWC